MGVIDDVFKIDDGVKKVNKYRHCLKHHKQVALCECLRTTNK